ncbi:synapse differentiation-inducing gene protein 1-like [Podarcis raffonei]|uniref:synapse differentiation-inducing gene protein 1-like n=1 Tax=Podarcis raffonei TaxID=65483 RepID=UPI0023294768|nr:synapse differentiation-inducing gene protein 1-like [Podarcis raffonei]
MSDPNYEKKSSNWPDPQAPPPFSENQPFESEADPLAPPGQPPPAPGYGSAPSMPPLYQAYYGPPDSGGYQGSAQTPQAIFIVPPQPTNEPDHLYYSIFTMLCCCLPLGIAALIFSIKTRDANLAGNGTVARQHSRTAQLLSHLAVGAGLTFICLYIILTVVMFKARSYELQNP